MSELKRFRLINKIEGWSYLILIFIAMPIKYELGYPAATKIIGMAHGALFVGFIYQLIIAAKRSPFSMKETLLFFIASLIPFGTMFTDKIILKHIERKKLELSSIE